jgi:uronate dehydrogenase
LRGRYALLRLADIRSLGAAGACEELVSADLRDYDAMRSAMQDIDCVVHLGGIPRENTWDAILDSNIVGTYNVFEAARVCKVKRVVFASSNHVVGYYRASRKIGIEEPARPDSRYGVSKVFGEALGRMYADKHGMSVACLRIGSFRPEPQDARQLSTWISPRDTVQLVQRCIEAPDFHFVVLYGVSANKRSRWNNPHAARIGYQPLDNSEAFASRFGDSNADGTDPALECHGGPFCALEFDGVLRRID